MFYTGLDPRTMKPVYVPVSPEEKAMQRALMQFFIPKNRPLVRKALRLADRDDLIGSGRNCLVPDVHQSPAHSGGSSSATKSNHRSQYGATEHSAIKRKDARQHTRFGFPEQSRSNGPNRGVQGKKTVKTSDKRSGVKKHR